MKKIDFEKNNLVFVNFLDIIALLRSPDGCPWDKEQTPASLRAALIEECYEVVEAIDENDSGHVREELGDVLILVSMLSQIYAEDDFFNITDVIEEVTAKLIRRHPHVFGDEKVHDAEEVLKNWERIKIEVEGRVTRKTPFERIPGSLPTLERSYKIQKIAAKSGFDWPDISGPRGKILEELAEIEDAVQTGSSVDIESELGDLLFSVVNFARHLGVNPSLALASSNRKFEERFCIVENRMREDGIEMKPENIQRMDSYWDSAKKETQSQN